MATVRDRTKIPVPRVFAYDVSPSNEVGCPYVLMERLPGRVLGGTIVSKVQSNTCPKLRNSWQRPSTSLAA
jgi:aminoglycoside phosphotransferase (APT) family kinase protein